MGGRTATVVNAGGGGAAAAVGGRRPDGGVVAAVARRVAASWTELLRQSAVASPAAVRAVVDEVRGVADAFAAAGVVDGGGDGRAGGGVGTAVAAIGAPGGGGLSGRASSKSPSTGARWTRRVWAAAVATAAWAGR